MSRYPGTINLLLTDLDMPGLPWAEMVAAARGLRPRMRVLYMSGSDVGHHDTAALRPFLAKPFTVAALVDAVTRALQDGQPIAHGRTTVNEGVNL